MNPSYDNSVGSFNSGGTNPGGVGADQPVQPVQPIQSAQPPVQPLQPVVQSNPQDQFGQFGTNQFGAGQFGQPVQQPVVSANMNAPISSGTDDIYLNGNGVEQKSRKGLIIGIIVALIVVAVIGVVVALVNSGIFAKSEQEKENDLEVAYNSFANYVLHGEESTNKISFYDIGDAAPYFESLAYDERDEYVEKAQTKYDELEAAYYEYMGYDENGEPVENDEEVAEEEVEEEVEENSGNEDELSDEEVKKLYDNVYGSVDDIKILESYYVEYASVEPITIKELIESRINDGIAATRDLINEHYRVVDLSESNEILNMYYFAARNYIGLEFDSIVAADDAGCIVDYNIVQGCYNPSEEELLNLKTEYNKMTEMQENLYAEVILTMQSMYYLIYGVDSIRYESNLVDEQDYDYIDTQEDEV